MFGENFVYVDIPDVLACWAIDASCENIRLARKSQEIGSLTHHKCRVIYDAQHLQAFGQIFCVQL